MQRGRKCMPCICRLIWRTPSKRRHWKASSKVFKEIKNMKVKLVWRIECLLVKQLYIGAVEANQRTTSPNFLKRRQDILDNETRNLPFGRACNVPWPIATNTIAFTPNTTTMDKILSANFENVGGGSKSLTKPECLTAQAKSMVLMTRILEGSSEVEKIFWWLSIELAIQRLQILRFLSSSKW